MSSTDYEGNWKELFKNIGIGQNCGVGVNISLSALTSKKNLSKFFQFGFSIFDVKHIVKLFPRTQILYLFPAQNINKISILQYLQYKLTIA